MRILAALVLLLLTGAPASADQIARSLFDLGVVQAGDAATTSGPRLGTVFPGGFVAQDQAGGCVGKNVAPVAGGKCYAFEIDAAAVRAGCVNNVFRDVGCAVAINFAVNGIERLLTRYSSEKDRNRVAVLNRLFALLYAGVIWPNNIRVDNAIGKHGVFAAPRTVTVWSRQF